MSSCNIVWVYKCGIVCLYNGVWLHFCTKFSIMDEEKFKKLMDEIRQSSDEACKSRQEFEQQLVDLKKDITTSQEN